MVDGLFAIARGLHDVARAIDRLGNGNASTQMGAIEAFGEKLDVSRRSRMTIDGKATARIVETSPKARAEAAEAALALALRQISKKDKALHETAAFFEHAMGVLFGPGHNIPLAAHASLTIQAVTAALAKEGQQP